MVTNIMAFERAWALIGATAEDCAHISFPLGVHPVAHLYARAAINLGIGTVWCGAGSNTPSETQLELIEHLQVPEIGEGVQAMVAERLARDDRGLGHAEMIEHLRAPRALELLALDRRERLGGDQQLGYRTAFQIKTPHLG